MAAASERPKPLEKVQRKELPIKKKSSFMRSSSLRHDGMSEEESQSEKIENFE